MAGLGIHTRLVFTFIGINQTHFASPMGRAGAFEAVDQILTGAPVFAWVGCTVIHIDVTGWAGPADCTDTLVTLTGLLARPSVGTWVGKTGVFRSFTVDPGVSISTRALVLVRSCIAACSSIQTRLVSPTVVQIFVTKLSTPVRVTKALPRFHTRPVDTAGVRDALITVETLPAVQTLAASWSLTGSMFCAATLSADSCIALRTRPTFQAGLVSVRITGVVSKELVTWPTELVASEAVVVFIAGDPDLVVKLGDGTVVGQPLPLSIRVDHARVVRLLDELCNRTFTGGIIIEVQGLHYQRVGPRPRKTEG